MTDTSPIHASHSSGAADASSDPALPLNGLVVLDLTLARAGPTCVRHLADWGATVIRVQPPNAAGEEVIGRRDGPDYQNLHRNKRVISLDLKTPAGHAAFLRLVATADVVVENMRVNVKHRLKIGWEDLQPLNPRLVYASISGFGQTGPYAERAGVDQIAQGMSGVMAITGEPGRGPMRTGIAVADVTAGNLLALAIMMALYERQSTGKGRWVHTSLLESMLFMLDFQGARYLMEGDEPSQVGNDHPTAVPTGVFPTEDGHINIGASSSKQWERLCDALETLDWLDRPEWKDQKSRSQDRANVHAAVAEQTRMRSTNYWVERLNAAGVPCGPIYSVAQAFNDPQVNHLGIVRPMEHPRRGTIRLIGSPLNVTGVTQPPLRAAAVTGEDTADVLQSVGYSQAEIEEMRACGVTE